MNQPNTVRGDAAAHGDAPRPEPRSPDLVGRSAELAALIGALDTLEQGSARCVGVFGEPGIGKTRLLRELASYGRGQQRPVLWGAATEFERHVPFGLFTNALDDHLDGLDEAQLAALGSERVGLLRSMFPALPAPVASPTVAVSSVLDGPPALDAPAGPATTGVVDAERYLLHRAVRALLELLAQPAGLVLILDDLHWADEGSAELLDHLLRHPPRGPLLLVVAYRHRQLPSRLANALPAAVRRGVAEHVEIGPLTASEAKELLAARGARGSVPELYEASGGNPFYLEALAGGGDPGPSHPSTGPAAWALDEIAPPVRAALLAELAALTDEQRLVLHSAAIAGELCEPSLVAEIAMLTSPDVLAALDGLAARDLVRAADIPGRFAFRHPLVRHVAYESAGAGWRITAHARAAGALRAQGVSPAGRAHHVEASAGLGDLDAVQVLTEAATATLHASPATAAHWLAAALRLLPDDPALTFQRLGLLGLRARALGVSGLLRESRDVMREVVGLLPAEPAEHRAPAVAFCAMMERLLGNYDEARGLLLAELGALADPACSAAAQLTLELAAGHQMRGDHDAALDWAIRTQEIARKTADAPMLTAALATCVLTSYSASRLDERAFGWLDEAAMLFDSMPDTEVGRLLETATSLGWAEVNVGRYRPALRHLNRGLDVARATGQNHLVPYLLIALATAQGTLGQLAEAIANSEDALDAAVLLESNELQRIALSHKCWLYTWQGDLQAAAQFGEEALACAISEGLWFATGAQIQLAQTKLFAGDPAGCAELLLTVGKGPELEGIDRSAHPGTFQLLAAADAAQGRLEDALRWAKRSSEAAADLGVVHLTGLADLGWAQALMATDPGEAAERARQAAATFTHAGIRSEAARAHLLAGIALSAYGDRDGARAEFSRCRTLADDCGARLWRELAVREERRMNARLPRKSGTSDVDNVIGDLASLTERERAVAALVSVGMTNRQIAEKLFLSPKTVEVHLSRSYAKLGVSTRAALAGRWRDQSTADST